MLKRIFKVAKVLGLTLAALATILVAAVFLRWQRTFDAPLPEINASNDPALIEKGRYLVHGPGHCVGCHTAPEEAESLQKGETLPLAGGGVFRLPFGTVVAPNITPDPETGIGQRTDAQLARILRYGVRADGRVAMPFMEYHDMSDEDLRAVISFLRSQPPVRRSIPDHNFNFLGKALLAFVIEPVGPTAEPKKSTPAPDEVLARGEYLANSVAACASCHTKRNLMDGSFVGPRFSGGFEMEMESQPGTVLVTPNLTPHPGTGRIASWTEEQFIQRFQAGAGMPGSHMPWPLYKRMSRDDLAAIYRYLQSLPPVANDTGSVMQQRG